MRLGKFFIILAIASLVLVGCEKPPFASLGNKNIDIEVLDKPAPGIVAVIDSNIIITKPISNEEISSPIGISGRANVFNGKVLFRLFDSLNNIIATSSVSIANGLGWGFFDTSFTYPMPGTKNGFIEIYSKDETGVEKNSIKMPVKFENFAMPVVRVFFSNINEDPELIDCGKVYPVEREIEPTTQLIVATLGQLFVGVTEEETKTGFVSNLPETGTKLQKIDLKEGVLSVDFNQALQEDVAGSCRVEAIVAQITETLKQFKEVEEVVISINGETEDILQP